LYRPAVEIAAILAALFRLVLSFVLPQYGQDGSPLAETVSSFKLSTSSSLDVSSDLVSGYNN